MLEKDDKQSTESEVSEKVKGAPKEERPEENSELPGFSAFSMKDKLVECLQAKGWKSPTPIQEQALVHTLKGKDLVGLAQTGSGKTGAFLITMAQRLFAAKASRSQP